MQPPASTAPADRPESRFPWRLVALVAVVALAVIGPPLGFVVSGIYQGHVMEAELRAVIAELDENDPHWRLEEIEAARPPLPDAENAALKVIEVQRKMPKFWGENLFQNSAGERVETPPPVQLDAEQVKLLRAELARAEEPLRLARALRNFARGRYRIAWSTDWLGTLLNEVQDARQVAQLLDADAQLLAHDSRSEEAWRSTQSLYRVSTSIGNPDMLIVLLVRVAIRAIALNSMERVLAQGEVSEGALAETQRMLEDDLKEPIIWLGLRGERAGMHQLFVALEQGKVSLAQVSGAGPRQSPALERLSTFLGGDIIRPSHVWMLRHMSKAVDAARFPDAERIEAFRKIGDELNSATADGSIPVAANMLLPAHLMVVDADVRIESQINCAICALACERYRLRHKTWPPSLEDLMKEKLLQRVPTDPYSGKSLTYQRTAKGIIVFAVGPDRDNKGASLDDPYIVTPEVRIEFRIWNPDRRRQPPRPPKKTGKAAPVGLDP